MLFFLGPEAHNPSVPPLTLTHSSKAESLTHLDTWRFWTKERTLVCEWCSVLWPTANPILYPRKISTPQIKKHLRGTFEHSFNEILLHKNRSCRVWILEMMPPFYFNRCPCGRQVCSDHSRDLWPKLSFVFVCLFCFFKLQHLNISSPLWRIRKEEPIELGGDWPL